MVKLIILVIYRPSEHITNRIVGERVHITRMIGVFPSGGCNQLSSNFKGYVHFANTHKLLAEMKLLQPPIPHGYYENESVIYEMMII